MFICKWSFRVEAALDISDGKFVLKIEINLFHKSKDEWGCHYIKKKRKIITTNVFNVRERNFGNTFRTGFKSNFNHLSCQSFIPPFCFWRKKKKSKFPRILFEHFWKGICPRFCKLLTFYFAMPYKHIKGYFVVAYLGF